MADKTMKEFNKELQRLIDTTYKKHDLKAIKQKLDDAYKKLEEIEEVKKDVEEVWKEFSFLIIDLEQRKNDFEYIMKSKSSKGAKMVVWGQLIIVKDLLGIKEDELNDSI